MLVDGEPLSSVVRPVAGFPHLYCAPAAIDLAGAEIELVPMVAREARLARAVGSYDASNLDYIFIDCPPSLGLLTVNALVAAPEVLIPIQCEYYALEGLEQLLRTVDLVRSHLNPALAVYRHPADDVRRADPARRRRWRTRCASISAAWCSGRSFRAASGCRRRRVMASRS